MNRSPMIQCGCRIYLLLLCIGVTQPVLADDSIRHTIWNNETKLLDEVVGTKEQAVASGVPNANASLRARLEVVDDRRNTIRIGLECIDDRSDMVYGNVWLDPKILVPCRLMAFNDAGEKFIGYLVVPTQSAVGHDRTQYIAMRRGVYVGRILEFDHGELRPWNGRENGMLPKGDYWLQALYSARVRDDSQEGRQFALKQLGDPDSIHCRSERRRISIQNAKERNTDEDQDANSDLQCLLRPIGKLPQKVGDPVLFEISLENRGIETRVLDGPFFGWEGGFRFDGTLLLTRKESDDSISRWDISQSASVRFRKLPQGSSRSLFKRPPNSTVHLPPKCFASSKIYIEHWEISGEFSLEVIFTPGLLKLDHAAKQAQIPPPKSAVICFSVAE